VVYGRFAPLSPAGDAVRGLAQLTRRLEEGVTDAEVYAYGLLPSTSYAVHVHALPCELGAAGPHYKLDPAVAETVEANEVWPAFTTNANGAGRASVRAAGLLRGDAMSVVIHNPADGTKMSCANLTPASGAASFEGAVAPYAAAEAGDQTIAGAATASVSDAGSEVTLRLTGLDPAAQYNLHVHALPCGVNAAGGHYKVDPTVAEVIASNEVWPALGAIAADGSATATVSTPHRLRSDAQSVVVHRATASGAPKVACADLTRVTYAPVTRPSGALNVLPAAAAQGVGGVMADAALTLALDGSSSVTLNATGLAPNASYNVHLHTDSCAVANGGGHYLINPAGMPEEANELWPNLRTDATGAASSTVSAAAHTLRPEAHSIVVHGDMGARLLCLELP
jgi:uncharacterized RmlC-like cupin family protein